MLFLLVTLQLKLCSQQLKIEHLLNGKKLINRKGIVPVKKSISFTTESPDVNQNGTQTFFNLPRLIIIQLEFDKFTCSALVPCMLNV